MNPVNYLLVTGRLLRFNQVRSYVSTCLSYRENCHIFFGRCKQTKAHYPLYIQKFIFKDCRNKLRCFSTVPDKDFLQKQRTKVTKEFKNYIEQNKERLRDTEQRIKDRGSIILQDIKDTKEKVKGRVEEIIEKDNMYTIPNVLCVLRILLSPYLGMLIIQSDFNFALGVLGVAAVTDLLDGWIARTWTSQSSKMGSFLDPLADKVLIATLFLSLTYADLIPLLLTSIIISRDVLLIIAGFVIRYRSLSPPRTLSRYFDVTYATVQLAPTFISKVNTAVQLVLVGSTLAAPIFAYVDHPLLQALWYITGATTIAAGASYALSKNTYKFVKREKTK